MINKKQKLKKKNGDVKIKLQLSEGTKGSWDKNNRSKKTKSAKYLAGIWVSGFNKIVRVRYFKTRIQLTAPHIVGVFH